MNIQLSQFSQRLANYAAGILFSLTMIALFVPFATGLPRAGLDASYSFGLNQAVAQGLVFGRDIVFPFGPYASIFSRDYHPGTDHLMVWGSFFLAGCYIFLSLLLARGCRFRWLWVYGVFLAATLYLRDSLFLSYPLFLGLVIYRLTLQDEDVSKLHLSRPLATAFPILFVPFGLLPLIKALLLPLCAIMTLLGFLLLWTDRQRIRSCLLLLVPSISCPLFWWLAGQPLNELPAFFVNSGFLIAGFSEAMSLNGESTEIILFILAAAVVIYVATLNRTAPLKSRIILCLIYGSFLFAAFKNGFVRHDVHAVTAGSSIVIAGFSVAFLGRTKNLFICLLLSFLTWGYIDRNYVDFSPRNAYVNVRNTYVRFLDGLRSRLADTGNLRASFDSQLSAIGKEFPIPMLEGTTDIYSHDQSHLLASRNTWSPRPVFQSYSSYTDRLAKLDQLHLLGEKAPDHILLRIEPIDNRLPSLENGPSWPTLVNNYFVAGFEDDLAYFERRESRSERDLGSQIYSGIHSLGEVVLLPETSEPVFAEVRLSPTLLGSIFRVLFKPPLLDIVLRLADGRSETHRFIASMGRSGFLISPLIETTEAFVFLTSSDSSYLNDEIVKSIVIAASKSGSIFWRESYSLTLWRLELTRDTDVVALGLAYKADSN